MLAWVYTMVEKTMGIKPYFETELGRLYCGRCEDILPRLEQANICLTDPPYGIGETNKKNMSRGALAKPKDYGEYSWDKQKISDTVMSLVLKSSKNQIIFGGNYYGSILGDTPCYLVWNKDNGLNDFADCELAWTSFKRATRLIRWRWHGMLKEAPEIRYHPTQKSVGLFQWILDKYSKSNDLILDAFMGSGTTAIACERLNRKWIGIEKEEEYCEIAAKRIEQEASQLKLFR